MTKNISRRNFIKISGITGAALSLGIYLPANAKEAEILNVDIAEKSGIDLNAWISIDTSGKVTIINHRSEMGQGSWQAVPQIIAEELEVDLNKVNIVFAQGNNAKYGSQITGGSSTVRGSYTKLLKISASAREMLIEVSCKKMECIQGRLLRRGWTCHSEIDRQEISLWRVGRGCIEARSAKDRKAQVAGRIQDHS